MATASLCPPAPADVPVDLAAPTSQYKMQTFLVLLALGLFFLLYFGLMFFCLLYSIWAVLLSPQAVRVPALICTLPLGVLFLYMLKNLLKSERAEKEFLLELYEDEHPKLFHFIEKVCRETRAPMPTHVYVDYSVNAYAMPDRNSIFRLFLPTGKSLTIGLGLVNGVNLTEFKAMLAHEFGHFSQNSTHVATFVVAMHRIFYHVVNGEDFFDRFIADWTRLNNILAVPGYVIYALLWVLRKIVGMMWFVVAYLFLGLRREQEFNADLVAVSATGSDAPVHLLYRCYFADASFTQAVNDLRVAMDHHIYTSDLFHHQTAASGFLRSKKKDPRLGEPPELPDDPNELTQVFEEDDDKVAQMWESHPSPYDREENAKAYYIRTHFDERSPWLLFENAAELRERVTFKFYRYYFKIPRDVILADPEEVQGFIDDEHADRTYDPRYQGLYDNRNIMLDDVGDLANEGARQPWTITELGQAQATLYNAETKHRSQLYYKRHEEKQLLTAVINGWHRPKNDELEFRGDIYELADGKRLLKKVDQELEKDHDWLKELDCRVFMTYFQMALHITQEVAEELYRRYQFHLELQKIWYELQRRNQPIQNAIGFLNSLSSTKTSAPLHRADFQELLSIFRDTHRVMRHMLAKAEDLILPMLKNLPAGQPLRPFLMEKSLIDSLSKYEHKISERWIVKLLNQFNEMKAKVDRIHFKSLAGILALQERIGVECVRRWSSLPKVQAAPGQDAMMKSE